MFDGRWRDLSDRALRPVGAGLQRTGVTADQLTATGLVMAGACAVAVATGHTTLGMVLLAASSGPDVLDGAVAKAAGTASPRGAFFDSVADRVSDALVLGGIAWYLGDVRGGQWPMLAVAVLGLSMLISYERAKAESLGYEAKGGLMERAERLLLIGIGLAFPVLLVPILVVMAVLTGVTAVQRFVKVWRQASKPRPEVEDEFATRWRTWRVQVAQGMRARPREPRAEGALGERWRARRTTRPASRAIRRRARTRP